MERKDKILTQEEYMQIRAEITKLEMEQKLTTKDNSRKIEKLKEKLS